MVGRLEPSMGALVLQDRSFSSDLELPQPSLVNYQEIVDEFAARRAEIEEYADGPKEPVPRPTFQHTECEYIQNEVFPQLLPALEETLNKAALWDALVRQKCFFNGIDYLAQLLYNNNPRYPTRKKFNDHIFNMRWVRDHLKKHPRPFYPKSWLWPEQYAATMIQKTVRQYFVQREEEVQEMREFWRKIKLEQSRSDLMTNPFLRRRLAAESQHRSIADTTRLAIKNKQGGK